MAVPSTASRGPRTQALGSPKAPVHKIGGGRRSGRLGEPPGQGAECVGKPCRHLSLGGPASPAAPLLPGGSPRRSLWVNIKNLWYKARRVFRPGVMGFAAAALLAALLAASGPAFAHQAHEKPAPEPLALDIGGPFALIDHQGHPVTDRDFHGRFLLVFFGYANCPGVCPIGLHNMTAALDLLGAKQGAAVAPVLITVDPARDTPASLGSAVAKIHPRLIGLTGTPEDLADARRAYMVGAEVTGQDLAGGALYRHGTFIYLMGPDGKFLSLFPPVMPPAALAAAIARYLS